ncbi:uncharacterized protein BKCO1_19000205 [Diplodia corticola]|uniref:Uncharacterized protein n=1 Tax=Diplodia corticola TaxID=236234 RepID=A0A1J9R3J5_9PEZI|nr:uncharacterized protein BKCO1_19000205 [Diplodia corticola]OJD35184.1 hypothetical protein BKCO1_19000205 [Diplodia corticola]
MMETTTIAPLTLRLPGVQPTDSLAVRLRPDVSYHLLERAPKLDGPEAYESWACNAENALAEGGYRGFIDGTWDHFDRTEWWRHGDAQAQEIIESSCADSILHSVLSEDGEAKINTAAKLWRFLKAAHGWLGEVTYSGLLRRWNSVTMAACVSGARPFARELMQINKDLRELHEAYAKATLEMNAWFLYTLSENFDTKPGQCMDFGELQRKVAACEETLKRGVATAAVRTAQIERDAEAAKARLGSGGRCVDLIPDEPMVTFGLRCTPAQPTLPLPSSGWHEKRRLDQQCRPSKRVKTET